MVLYLVASQVGFHSDNLVKKAQVARRLNEIVNRLNKTQVGPCNEILVHSWRQARLHHTQVP
jgi:hypothetical protein